MGHIRGGERSMPGSGADMPAPAPHLREFNLTLALGISLTVVIGTGIETMRARYAGGKLR